MSDLLCLFNVALALVNVSIPFFRAIAGRVRRTPTITSGTIYVQVFSSRKSSGLDGTTREVDAA